MSDRTLQGGEWRPAVLLAVVLAMIVFAYPLALPIPLLDPDEGLHASIAQEMVERGDWVIPRLGGEPFLDKPILYFWAQAVSLRLLGMHEAAVRLPGLLFGLLGAVTTAVVGWRLLGQAVGLVAGLCYATMVLPTALAQAAAHDVALVPWVNLSVLLFWELDHAGSRRTSFVCTLAVGILLGLSILTKGLPGVAIVGVAYGGYLLATRRLRLSVCLYGAGALATAALVASTWYAAVEMRNPGYLHYYFVERHLLGFATDTQLHANEPWWYYLPILIGGGLPWIAYLPVVVADAWLKRRQTASGAEDRTSATLSPATDGRRAALEGKGSGPLLWCWLLGGLLLLSMAQSKLVTYLWPVFPPVAILAAVAWVRLIDGSLRPASRRMLDMSLWISCLGGPVVLPAAMAIVQEEFSVRFTPAVWIGGVAASLTALAPLGFWIAGRIRAVLLAAMAAIAVQFVASMTLLLPVVGDNTSAESLAEHFNQEGRVPARVLMAEECVGSVRFYLAPRLRAGLRADQIVRLRLHENSRLPQPLDGAVLVVAERRCERVGRYIGLAGADFQKAGRYRVYDAAALEGRIRTAARTAPPAHR